MSTHLRMLLASLLLLLTIGGALGAPVAPRVPASPQAVLAPVFKWQECYPSWCETGWYSSPAVADLDGDGDNEVIGSAYSVVVRDGATGDLVWRAPSGAAAGSAAGNVGRTWPGIVVADIDGVAGLEIVTAHGGGYVMVYNPNGTAFNAGVATWPQRPYTGEIRSLAVDDIDDNGDMEIVVSVAAGGSANTRVLEHTGAPRAGWPQLSNPGTTNGYASGVYNSNAGIGNLDGDDGLEIVVPSDVHYIAAYQPDGSQLATNAMFGSRNKWALVGIWEAQATELKGWGECSGIAVNRAESLRTNFAGGPATIADLDGDGVNEVVGTGNVYDCPVGHPVGSKYMGVYVWNADRSRFDPAGPYDWRSTVPINTGAPLTEDYAIIENAQPNSVVADLDGDGEQEILYPSYDGRLHAFWLDKTEHGNWPYEVYTGGAGNPYRFASEPAVADLDRDGHAEVIFSSWGRKGLNQPGKLHIVDYMGNSLHEVNLPAADGSNSWNGALAAPTIDNIDGDAELEVVLNTAHSGLVAYDLPGTAGAPVFWRTGRGNYQRTGSLSAGTLRASKKSVSASQAQANQTLSYTITIANTGETQLSARMTDTLPLEVTFAGGLTASSGTVSQSSGVVTWSGVVGPNVEVTISFNATVKASVSGPAGIVNDALIDEGQGAIWTRRAVTIANPLETFVPMVGR